MQLQLFPNEIMMVFLQSDSPKKAWWRLTLIEHNECYALIKESGIKGRMLDRRMWPMRSAEKAKKMFDRKVKEKLNPSRKSPRKYEITNCDNWKNMIKSE